MTLLVFMLACIALASPALALVVLLSSAFIVAIGHVVNRLLP